ncbi:MAG: GAF domain-containing protein [Anaerolineae bacterium]
MAIRPEYAKRIAIHQFKVRRHLGKTLFPYSPGNQEAKEKWDAVQSAAATGSDQFDQDFAAILEAVIASVSQKADTAKILAGLLPHALALCEVESGGFLVVGDEKNPQNGKANHLIVVNRQNLPDEVIKHLIKGPLAQQLLSGQMFWLQPQPYQLNVEQALLGRHKLKYLFGLPVQAGDEVLGAVVIASHTLRPDRAELEHRLRTLAQIVALFLENLRLKTRQAQLQGELAQQQVNGTGNKKDDLEDLLAAVMSAEEEVIHQNRDLGMLNAFSHEIAGTLQLNVILEAAVGQSNSLLQAEASWCYMYESGSLVLREQRGLSERYVAEMKFLEPGNGVEGMAFSRKQPIVRDGMLFHTGHVRTLLKEEGLRVVAAVPLVAQGKVFGVLAAAKISSRRGRRVMSVC